MLSEAYICGVLHGDGYCTDVGIGINAADEDFVEAFSTALNEACGTRLRPNRNGAYWRVFARNTNGKFWYLLSYEPQTLAEQAMWVRGLFDSEGNAQLRPNGISQQSYGRRVAMYSTKTSTLERAATYLSGLGIPTRLFPTKNSQGHKGTLTVYGLEVRGGRENYSRFASLIGSSLARKQRVLNAIPQSYQSDPLEHARNAQRIGAASKHRKTIEITLPMVLEGIRELIRQGIKPTQRNCRAIPGYNTIQGLYPQATLIAMAIEE